MVVQAWEEIVGFEINFGKFGGRGGVSWIFDFF